MFYLCLHKSIILIKILKYQLVCYGHWTYSVKDWIKRKKISSQKGVCKIVHWFLNCFIFPEALLGRLLVCSRDETLESREKILKETLFTMHPGTYIPQSELEKTAGLVSHFMKRQSATHQNVVNDQLPHSTIFNTYSGQDLQLDETEGIKKKYIYMYLKNRGFSSNDVCCLKLVYKD